MLRLIDDKTGRTRTFYSDFDVNRFTWSYDDEANHEAVTEALYIKMCIKKGFKQEWDDGTPMDAADWVKCVKEIYKSF